MKDRCDRPHWRERRKRWRELHAEREVWRRRAVAAELRLARA